MKKNADFIQYAVTLIILLLVGFPTIKLGIEGIARDREDFSVLVNQVQGQVRTGDLNKVSGEAILGMVLNALNGEYVIVVDGITIDENTNMDTVSLSGVIGRTYKITSVSDSNFRVSKVVASII